MAFDNINTFFKVAYWPVSKPEAMREMIAQVLPLSIGLVVFGLLAAFVLWRFAEVIATTLGGYNYDEAMARVATLSIVDVQSLIFVGIGIWMVWGSLFYAVLTALRFGSSIISPASPFLRVSATTLEMSATYQGAQILGGVALIFFARPLARFTQREKKENP